MNILIIGKFGSESFGLHIAETLTQLGHQTFRFEAGVKSTSYNHPVFDRWFHVKNSLFEFASKIPAVRKIEYSKLFKIIEENKIDLIIITHDFLLPEIIDRIKSKTKAPIALWFPDHVGGFGKAMFLNAAFDYLFFKDPYIVSYVSKMLLKQAFYLPECCNPVYHKPVELTADELKTYSCEITTAGNLYSNREAFFKNLKSYDVKIWGSQPPLWMNTKEIKRMIMNRYVYNEEKAKAFKAAKIVLNNLNTAEIFGINVRAFEIPACEGFQLINWKPGIEQLFTEGEEIISFSDFADLKEKIDFYLKQEELRKRIAKAGCKRAHNEHTYELRIRLMLDTIFGEEKGFPLPEIKLNNMNITI